MTKSNEIIIKKNYAIIKILCQGKNYNCLIDKEDIDIIKPYYWHLRIDKRHPNCTPYVESIKFINKKRIRIHLHRLIMECPQNMVVDHINHNGLDNRKENLRICNQKTNTRNRKTSSHINYVKRDDIYNVSFYINGKAKYLCYTRDIKEAKYYAKLGEELFKNNKIEELLNIPCKKLQLQRNNTTGYKGISRLKNGKYQVRYKCKYIGTVKSVEDGINLLKNYTSQSQNNF